MADERGSKHTKGPWKINSTPKNSNGYLREPDVSDFIVEDSDNYVLAIVVTDIEELKECGEANARLIAAAPELLEIARAVARYCEDEFKREISPATYQKALDCIKEAEGQ